MKVEHLKHKGYQGSINHDLKNGILYGTILFVNDAVSYETSGSLEDLKAEFIAAVEDYLETCKALKREPQKPCKGSFNIRISPEEHREAVILSSQSGQTLNEFCKAAIAEKIKSARLRTSSASNPKTRSAGLSK